MAKKLQPRKPTDEERLVARQLLREDGDTSKLPAAIWLGFATELAEAEDIETLKQLEASVADKKVQKGLRGLYHRLRSRGVDVEANRARRVSIARSSAVCIEAAAASYGTLSGDIMVYLAVEVPGESTVAIMGRLGGEPAVGMERTGGSVARRDVRQLVDSGYLSIAPDYARYLIGRVMAFARNQRTSFEPQIVEIITLLGRIDESPHPLDSALADAGVEKPTSVATSADLMGLKLQPDQRFLKPFADRLVELLESPIILGDAVRADRIAKICRESVREMVGAIEPGIVSLCMRHNGYFCLLDGLPRDAATFARIADLLDEGVPAEEIPLFFESFQLIASHLLASGEPPQQPEEPPSLIIKP